MSTFYYPFQEILVFHNKIKRNSYWEKLRETILFARFVTRFSSKKCNKISDEFIKESIKTLSERNITSIKTIEEIIDEYNMEDCLNLYIDDKLYCDNAWYDDQEDTKLYTKESNYKLPKDLYNFYKKYNGIVLDYFEDRDIKESIYFIPIENVSGSNEMFIATYSSNDIYKLEKIYIKDWFTLLYDQNSVDNNHGSVFTNLNPESEYFGSIWCYTSSDDGIVGKAAETFTEFIEKCLKLDIACYDSIVDCMNYDEPGNGYGDKIDNNSDSEDENGNDWLNAI